MTSAADEFGAGMRPRDGDLMGHPRGLLYLVGVEGFWAFAFFGLQGLLTLYMTRHLLLPGHAEHIIGFSLYERLLQGGGPPLKAVEIASQTFGLFSSLSYALPLMGAVIADRWLGTRRTMMLGLAAMVVAMAVVVTEPGFLIGVALIILGNGLVKCNLMVSIGRLYATDDPRRTSAFAIYLIFANIGAFSWPLIAGTLSEKVNFPVGISALAIGMALALGTYLLGRPHLPADAPPAAKAAAGEAGASAGGHMRIALILVAALVPEVLYFGAYQQSFNVFPVWAADHVQRSVFGFEFPVTWFSTLDGLLTIAGAMVTIRLWDAQIKRGRPMGDMTRLAIGCGLGVIGFGILAVASLGAQAPALAAVAYFAFVDPAITWVDTVTLALVSRTAPASINSTMVAVYGLSMAASYYMTGQLGRLYAHLTPSGFWSVHVGVMAAGVVFLVVAGPFIARALAGHNARVAAA